MNNKDQLGGSLRLSPNKKNVPRKRANTEYIRSSVNRRSMLILLLEKFRPFLPSGNKTNTHTSVEDRNSKLWPRFSKQRRRPINIPKGNLLNQHIRNNSIIHYCKEVFNWCYIFYKKCCKKCCKKKTKQTTAPQKKQALIFNNNFNNNYLYHKKTSNDHRIPEAGFKLLDIADHIINDYDRKKELRRTHSTQNEIKALAPTSPFNEDTLKKSLIIGHQDSDSVLNTSSIRQNQELKNKGI